VLIKLIKVKLLPFQLRESKIQLFSSPIIPLVSKTPEVNSSSRLHLNLFTHRSELCSKHDVNWVAKETLLTQTKM